MVGPDYVRPSAPAPVPDTYREMAGWKRAEPRDAIERGRWWEVFGDPELNALAARVEISNQNLRAAEANFRQAQALAEQARAGLFPTVGAGASAIRSKSPSLSNQPSFATGAVNNFNLNVNASWELDLWGKVRRGIESGEANWQASAADLERRACPRRPPWRRAISSLRSLDAQRRVLTTRWSPSSGRSNSRGTGTRPASRLGRRRPGAGAGASRQAQLVDTASTARSSSTRSRPSSASRRRCSRSRARRSP